MAASPSGPGLSVVLVTPDRFETIRRVVRDLRAQTIRDRIELVIVAPAAAALADARAEELTGFAAVVPVHAGGIDNVDAAAAEGIRAASAPVVALLEDHAFPDADWCEAMLEAHRGPWAAVGSAVLNANPDSYLSWTNMLIAYGRWPENGRAGETRDIARHNSTFKRDVLLSFGDRLTALLERSGGLLAALLADGHRFYFEPRVRVRHVNPSTLSSTLELRMQAGRLYAGTRAEKGGWSSARRALYLAGAALIPPVRMVRQRKELFGGRRGLAALRVAPALLLGLTLDAAGQAVGYIAGPGATRDALARFEMGRSRHITARDREALAT